MASQFRTFVLPRVSDEAAEQELNAFLRSHRIATISRTYDGGCWCICVEWLDGEHDWISYVYDLGEGSHAVEWRYVKDELDDQDTPKPDGIWVRNVVWMPEMPQMTEVPVPTAWLKAKYPSLGDYYFDYEEQAKAVAANGVNTVWECYVIGLEPTASDARFVAAIEMIEGVPKVTWSPDLGSERVYRVLGSTDLKTWAEVTVETKGLYNFFKVSVEMP